MKPLSPVAEPTPVAVAVASARLRNSGVTKPPKNGPSISDAMDYRGAEGPKKIVGGKTLGGLIG